MLGRVILPLTAKLKDNPAMATAKLGQGDGHGRFA
jgi:hypothetical protein